jgi:hypothetical protein
MLKLKQSNVTPPDLFAYKFPQDQFIVTAYDYDNWLEKIRKHAVDNDYPIPTPGECENQLCRRLSGEFCIGGGPHSFINTRFRLEDVLHGASALLTGSIVDKDVAEERARICSMCVANVPVQGCATCTGLATFVSGLKGAQSTKYDYLLKVCAVCKCPNESQVWYDAETLSKSVTPEMMETYREINESGKCWKWDLLALRAKSDTTESRSGTID